MMSGGQVCSSRPSSNASLFLTSLASESTECQVASHLGSPPTVPSRYWLASRFSTSVSVPSESISVVAGSSGMFIPSPAVKCSRSASNSGVR